MHNIDSTVIELYPQKNLCTPKCKGQRVHVPPFAKNSGHAAHEHIFSIFVRLSPYSNEIVGTLSSSLTICVYVSGLEILLYFKLTLAFCNHFTSLSICVYIFCLPFIFQSPALKPMNRFEANLTEMLREYIVLYQNCKFGAD